MIAIGNLLRAEDVALDLASRTATAAIAETAALLKDDPRVLDWSAVHAVFQKRAPCLPAGPDFSICLPHARTEQVTAFTLCAGRAPAGIVFPDTPFPVRYIFCLAVPNELAADYLRIVGLLVRMLKHPEIEAELRTAHHPRDFVETLARFEAKL